MNWGSFEPATIPVVEIRIQLNIITIVMPIDSIGAKSGPPNIANEKINRKSGANPIATGDTTVNPR